MKFEKYLLNNLIKTEFLYIFMEFYPVKGSTRLKLFYLLYKMNKWIKMITTHFENSMEHKHMLTVKTHIQTVINPLSD